MKYLFLSLSIVLEVVGSSFMKASDGFSKLLPTAITIVAYIACFFFLSQALKSIPLGIAYAIWGGLGIVLTAIISVVVFKQSLDIPAIIGIILIVTGVIVMNFCLNHFGNGTIEITKQGNFKIGKITMQRKGGDNGRETAKMLQFKINPAELFDYE